MGMVNIVPVSSSFWNIIKWTLESREQFFGHVERIGRLDIDWAGQASFGLSVGLSHIATKYV